MLPFLSLAGKANHLIDWRVIAGSGRAFGFWNGNGLDATKIGVEQGVESLVGKVAKALWDRM
jgi:hypothetical protein